MVNDRFMTAIKVKKNTIIFAYGINFFGIFLRWVIERVLRLEIG
jgi:hypothetical protein